MLRGHIFDTIAQNFCRTADSQTFEKLSESNILLSCNSTGLIFDFYLNRKRQKCWLADGTVATYLHISILVVTLLD